MKGQKKIIRVKIICVVIDLRLRRRCLVGTCLCKYFSLRDYFCSFHAAPARDGKMNYFRLCRLLTDVGSQALRETFDKIHPPMVLATVLATPSALGKLKSLRKKKNLTQSQWKKLYPIVRPPVLSKNFDITLLIVLLKNICHLTVPATGWDALPSPTDSSCEAAIACINFYINKVRCHAAQALVDDLTFHNYWMGISNALKRLGGPDYTAIIDGLKYDCLVPAQEEHFKELLMRWKMHKASIRTKMNNFEARVNRLEAKVFGSEEPSTSGK